ncbi:MAG: hypothetical protein PHO70_01565 [Candidatus Omnitrophica bacterium]|nr:hypothetical protein [Candidatus Omnitrophota bacterium]
MESKRSLENLRDCVRYYYENGAERGSEFKKMRHAIIVELKRLNYESTEIKGMLLAWNKKCEKVLPYKEQKRQLLDYIDWVDKKETKGKTMKVGCRALKDYCIGEDRCLFNKQRVYLGRKATEDPPFKIDELVKFLETRYKGTNGYVMYLITKNLRQYQMKKGLGEVIFIGHKSISDLIRDNDGHTIEIMAINRRIKDLISEGIIEIVVKGKKGSFSVEANGYRFLPWKPPSEYASHEQTDSI